MKCCLLLMIVFTLLVNVAAFEKRPRDLRLARPRKSFFNPIVHKTVAEQSQAPIWSNSPGLLVLKLRGGDFSLSKFSKSISESRAKSWVVLLIAILLDTFSSTMMKIGRDEGSAVKLLVAYLGFFTSLSGFALSLGAIEVSIAYAVWAALGTAIVSAVGIVCFNEKYDAFKLLGLGMIIAGVAIVEARS